MKKLIIALAAGLSLSSAIEAATQGELSTTASTATFNITGQGPATPRRVQVLNVSDVTFSNATHPQFNPASIGATMTFCVVDTYGGSVGLSFTSSNGADGTVNWIMKTPANEQETYRLRIELARGPLLGSNPGGSGSFSVTVPNSDVITSPASCGTGNIAAQIYRDTPMPETLPARTYGDTISVVATPQ
ncbi:MAG: hypothetical protein ACK6DI_10370 [Betaproteobacteria bacterium]